MTIIRSKKKSGVRNQVYVLASRYIAYYYQDKQHSIYYNGVDLEINLLFANFESAHRFVNEMLSYLAFTYLSSRCGDNYPVVHPDFPMQLVFVTHYDSAEYPDSATRSTIITERPIPLIQSKLTDEQSLMAIEKRNHSDFRGLNAYKCHLIGQAIDQSYAENANNVFYMTWAMHQRFDGLNSEFKKVPLIAIRFDGVGDKETKFGFERQRVNLIIECFNYDAFDTTLERLKDPYSQDAEKLEIGTFVHPEDVEDFIYCITYKYYETKAVWETITPSEETISDVQAAELRTQASKVAKSKLQQAIKSKTQKSSKRS